MIIHVFYKQAAGAVYISGTGSGKFTRVHFKENTAKDVSNLLFLLILEHRNLVKSGQKQKTTNKMT